MSDTMEVPPASPEFLASMADIPETLGGEVPGSPTDAATDAAASSPELTVDILSNAFAGTFGLIAMCVGEGGEFWALSEMESKNLAAAWFPVLKPLFDAWGVSCDVPWAIAAMMTAATVWPRLKRDEKRRAAVTAATETGKSGDSFSLPDQPAAEKVGKQTDSLVDPYAALSSSLPT